jgi:hypothetical protein
MVRGLHTGLDAGMPYYAAWGPSCQAVVSAYPENRPDFRAEIRVWDRLLAALGAVREPSSPSAFDSGDLAVREIDWCPKRAAQALQWGGRCPFAGGETAQETMTQSAAQTFRRAKDNWDLCLFLRNSERKNKTKKRDSMFPEPDPSISDAQQDFDRQMRECVKSGARLARARKLKERTKMESLAQIADTEWLGRRRVALSREFSGDGTWACEKREPPDCDLDNPPPGGLKAPSPLGILPDERNMKPGTRDFVEKTAVEDMVREAKTVLRDDSSARERFEVFYEDEATAAKVLQSVLEKPFVWKDWMLQRERLFKWDGSPEKWQSDVNSRLWAAANVGQGARAYYYSGVKNLSTWDHKQAEDAEERARWVPEALRGGLRPAGRNRFR